jgi:hypothetical protein
LDKTDISPTAIVVFPAELLSAAMRIWGMRRSVCSIVYGYIRLSSLRFSSSDGHVWLFARRTSCWPTFGFKGDSSVTSLGRHCFFGKRGVYPFLQFKLIRIVARFVVTAPVWLLRAPPKTLHATCRRVPTARCDSHPVSLDVGLSRPLRACDRVVSRATLVEVHW